VTGTVGSGDWEDEMSPQCEHCLNIFDATEMSAREGSTMACPSCGQQMTVHYTFKDSATDPDTWWKLPGNKSLKYVPRGRLIVYLLIVFGIIVAAVLMGAF